MYRREFCGVIILLVWRASMCLARETVMVNTTLGSVMGTIETVTIHETLDTTRNVSYKQFLGIPYAEPPTGNRRFAKPVPKEAWSDMHNGTYHRPMCHQGIPADQLALNNVQESEDCLTLDIYTPNGSLSDGDSNAVMIFIYGPTGASKGFVGDALSAYGDIIVVVINYRSTFLGFYSSGDSVAKGNYGLWDQQLAIRWVNTNIEAFNGDPSRVTVAGYSAGAQYVLLQAMYPDNIGLIYNVIAHSGILVPTYRVSSYASTGSTRTVQTLGCNRETSAATLLCLRSKTIDELNTALYRLTATFTPVIDGEFIKKDPLEILNSNDSETQNIRDFFSSVNLLTGINNMEGAMHVVRLWAPLLNQQVESFQINKSSFRNVVVKTALDLVFASNLSDAIVDTVVFQYSDLTDPTNMLKLRQSTVQLSTDMDATVPAIKTANLHSMSNTSSKTYFFQFSLKFTANTMMTPSWLEGANHGEEIYFLLGFSPRTMDAWTFSDGFMPTDIERNTSIEMMTLWSNFVKTG